MAVWTVLMLAATAGYTQEAPPAGGGGGTTGGGGGTTGGGGGTRTPTTPSPTTPGQQNRFPDQQRFPEMPRPIYLSGKVMLDDGTPPPEPVTIERICNGTPRPEAYTDSKGRFSFQLGQNNGMMADASYGAGMDGISGNDSFGSSSSTRAMGGMGLPGQRAITERDLMGCELRAVLAGYRSDVVNLSGRRSMDNPDVGTIVLRRMANVEGTTISAIAAQAPKDAKKAFEKGHNAMRKKKVDDAIKEYEKAIGIYPKYSTAYYELGRALEMKDNKEGAKQAYLKAIEIDPKYINPYRFLTGMAAREQNWKETVEYAQKVIKLDPVDYPDAFFYHAVGNLYLKNFETAEGSARDALKLDTTHQIPKIGQLLGMILIERGDYAGAAEQMKAYLKLLPPGAKDAEFTQKQIAELEKAVAAKGNQ